MCVCVWVGVLLCAVVKHGHRGFAHTHKCLLACLPGPGGLDLDYCLLCLLAGNDEAAQGHWGAVTFTACLLARALSSWRLGRAYMPRDRRRWTRQVKGHVKGEERRSHQGEGSIRMPHSRNPNPLNTHTPQAYSKYTAIRAVSSKESMAAAVPYFGDMNEAQLRQWVEANPGRVNDRDWLAYTPLYVAVCFIKSLPLTVLLLDEKGADVNATISGGVTPLHLAPPLDILAALMNRGGDPTHTNYNGWTPLMGQARHGSVENVARLVQDPRVRGTVNANCEWQHSTPLCLL